MWPQREALAFTLLPQQPIDLNAKDAASLPKTKV
jgi:hypothetical protein